MIHRLYKSHRTGNVVDSKMTRFSFPTGWRYDVLRALDFFQEYNVPKDERINDAIDLVLRRRNRRWKMEFTKSSPGKYFFEMEEVGKPSRWNTLRALRVLKWWENKLKSTCNKQIHITCSGKILTQSAYPAMAAK